MLHGIVAEALGESMINVVFYKIPNNNPRNNESVLLPELWQ